MAADGDERIVRQVGDEVWIKLPPGGPDALEMRFRPIPAKGRRFRMGQRGGDFDEQPAHKVELREDYWLGTFVVTQGEWRTLARWAAAGAFLRPDGKPWNESPSHFKGNDRLPVENLDWFDAGAWCAGLSKWLADRGAGYQARLPGEAEWEFACRAGTETDYWSGDGDDALDDVGWYSGNRTSKTHPVDQSVAGNDGPEANAFGLVGMHGNVYEWCRDGYDAARYLQDVRDGYDVARYLQDVARSWRSHSAGDPHGVYERRGGFVIRGGSGGHSAWGCRSACRYRIGPYDRDGDVGFRVCLVRGPCSLLRSSAAAEKPRFY
ncbi:MAG: formylglycine-generating enzyme family protein, partial [Planctomycetota bacterium]